MVISLINHMAHGGRSSAALRTAISGGWLVLALLLTGSSGWAQTNAFEFSYPDRSALLADGWTFVATSPDGLPRDTEMTNGSVVSYDQAAHPGVLRIPVDAGDLWGGFNNSRNSLFRDLPENWASIRLELSFWPMQNIQQAALLLYANDDNYVSVAHAFNGDERVALVQESGGAAAIVNASPVAATNLWLRLDREVQTGNITALYAMDGTNWTTVGQVFQTLAAPRLGVFCGDSSGSFPNADLRGVELILGDSPAPAVLSVQPQRLVFNATAGQPCTNLQQVRVLARGAGTGLDWTSSSSDSWVTCSDSAGTAPGTADLGVDATGLAPGTYSGAVEFTASATNSASVGVTLIVNPDCRARIATWRGAKAGAMSVSVDDSQATAFDDLSTNGLEGTYFMYGLVAPQFYTNVYLAGMEMGAHTVSHVCYAMDEAALRWQLSNNIAGLVAAVPEASNAVVSFAWPCGVNTLEERAIAADYFLGARGYNINQLEDASPYDFMNLKSFNSHEHPPSPPDDLKTVVDDAIAQGKWFNFVLHTVEDDDGAIDYSMGKDIWVAPIGSVVKYILQRDRTVITNYVQNSTDIIFDCYRLGLDGSAIRDFEGAVGPKDALTVQIDISGRASTPVLKVNGDYTSYALKDSGGATLLHFDLPVTTSLQHVRVAWNSSLAPVLFAQPSRIVPELGTLVVTNTALDPDTPPGSLSYSLLDPPAGATINSEGVITWTPTEQQGPSSNVITTIVGDGTLKATNSFTVTVRELNRPPTLPVQQDVNLLGGETLAVTNTADDPDFPLNALSYQLLPGPAGAVIDTNGIITWTPTAAQASGTYQFTTVATDYNPWALYSQQLGATNTFMVQVGSVETFLTIQSVSVSNMITTVSWNSLSGRTYRLQYTTGMANPDWQDASSDIPGNGGVLSATNAVGASSQRFYRVVQLP